MRRALAFIGLLLIFLIWTFPHQRLVERTIVPRMARLGIGISFDDVSFALPPAYTLVGVELTQGLYRLTLASARFGFGMGGAVSLDADACGGNLSGRLDKAESGDGNDLDLRLSFDGIDPALCLDLESFEVSGRFTGELHLGGLARDTRGTNTATLARSGALEVRADAGTVSGSLPASPTASARTGFALGEWSFSKLKAVAGLETRAVNISRLDVHVEGVEWHLAHGRLSMASSGDIKLKGDLRAREVENNPQSKALIGLLPKAGADREGWRRYTLAGTLSSPKLVGLK